MATTNFYLLIIGLGFILNVRSEECRNFDCSETVEGKCTNDESTFSNDWFTQKLDHFDPSSDATWGQHYQVQRKYYKDTGEQRIFLALGGEQDLSDNRMCFDNYTHMGIAKDNQALVVQLQHRFFGRNKGLRDTSVDMLRFLTVEQAIEDVVSFIKAFNEREKLTNPKWVLMGLSYSGYLRMTHPEISQGALASSAPMWPKLNFWEYDVAMTGVYNDFSPICVQEIRKAFVDLDHRLHSPLGRALINKKFRLSPQLDIYFPTDEDLLVVSSTFFYAFEQIVQRTYIGSHADTKRGGYVTVDNICNIMMNTSRPYPDRLYHVRWLAQHRRYPVLASYPKHVDFMTKTDIHGAPTRGWTWMTCSQFGWLQSSSVKGPFYRSAPLSHSVRVCRDTFGGQFDEQTIARNVQQTLERYGPPQKYNGTNIVFSHGSYDPWSTLGTFVNDSQRHVTSIMTKGSSHCADTFPYYPGEPTGLADARRIMSREVAYFYSLPSTFAIKNQPKENRFLGIFRRGTGRRWRRWSFRNSRRPARKSNKRSAKRKSSRV